MSSSKELAAHEAALDRAAELIRNAERVLVTAGAGIGVDSGLPDFRGDEGFWNAYPPYRHLGLDFASLANPRWFRRDPELAWGFYGHRLMLYRRVKPHAGFDVLRRWLVSAPGGGFVFTSNVDGQFQRAGFDDRQVVECHGSIHWLQCTERCGGGLFPADGLDVVVDPETFRARPPLPACPSCGALARPAILMFADGEWESARTDAQEEKLLRWLRGLSPARAKLVVVECGAGLAVPTVRFFGERLVERSGAKLVRINAREGDVPAGQVSLPVGALAALLALDARTR